MRKSILDVATGDETRYYRDYWGVYHPADVWLPGCQPLIRDTDGWRAIQLTKPDEEGLAWFYVTDPTSKWGESSTQYNRDRRWVRAHTSHTLIEGYR